MNINLKSYSPFALLTFILFNRLRYRILMLVISSLATIAGFAGLYLQKVYLDMSLNVHHDNDLITVVTSAATPTTLVSVSFAFIVGFYSLTQLANYIGGRESCAMQMALAQLCLRKVLITKSAGNNALTAGEISSIYNQDIANACFLMDFIFPQGLAYLLPLMVAPFALNYFFSVPMLPIFAIAILFVSACLAFALYQKSFFVRYKHLVAQRLGVIAELIRQFKLVRILGWTAALARRVKRARENETMARIQMVIGGMLANSVGSSLAFFVNIIVILILYQSDILPKTSGGILAILWMSAIFLTKPFRSMAYILTLFFNCYSSICRLSTFLLGHGSTLGPSPDTADLSTRPLVDPGVEAIHVRDMNLTLGSTSILASVDLHVEQGSFVAIIGEVGSGKTSLVLSLLGETPATTKLYNLFGVPAQDWGMNWTQLYSYVPQEGFLLNASLRCNVTLSFKPDRARDAEVLHALTSAQFDLEEDDMKDGLDTVIGEHGVNISGGQKLRINIARALYHQAQILILDDCFSALDLKTERRLIDAFLAIPQRNLTKIVVTHRTSVLEHVDKVMIMDSGRIVEQGSYQELLANSGRLQRIVEAEYGK